MAWIVLAFDGLDGISATAIIQRAAQLKGITMNTPRFTTYPHAGEALEQLPIKQDYAVFILDIAPTELKHLDTILARLGQARAVYWNTHHSVGKELSERIERAGVQFECRNKTSSAQMTTERFLPIDPIARELSTIATDLEFWHRADERSGKLSDLLTSGKDKTKLCTSLSRGVFWTQEWEQELKMYREKKKNALELLTKHITIKKASIWSVGYSLADSCLSSADAGQHLLEAHHAIDVAVILYRTGRISFRRRDMCSVNVATLARQFGGGGHEYASGAQLPKTITLATLQDTIFLVDQEIKKKLLS